MLHNFLGNNNAEELTLVSGGRPLEVVSQNIYGFSQYTSDQLMFLWHDVSNAARRQYEVKPTGGAGRIKS